MNSIFPEYLFSETEKNLLQTASSNQACNRALALIKEFDYKTYFHSVGVAQLVAAIAIRADSLIEDDDIVKPLVISGFEHDFGKLIVDKEIVKSNNLFNQSQWEEMKLHPVGSFFLSLMNHPDSPLIPSLGLRHHTLQTGSDVYGGSRSYPSSSDIHELEQAYLSDQVAYKKKAIGTMVLAVADQIEARIPIPRLNSHPYGDRSTDRPNQIIEDVFREFSNSPQLHTDKKALATALFVAADIMKETIDYHSRNDQQSPAV